MLTFLWTQNFFFIYVLTPSGQKVPPEVLLLRDEGESEQGLQVHAFHQQPEVISQDAELEESYSRFTRHLKKSAWRKRTKLSKCINIEDKTLPAEMILDFF